MHTESNASTLYVKWVDAWTYFGQTDRQINGQMDDMKNNKGHSTQYTPLPPLPTYMNSNVYVHVYGHMINILAEHSEQM